MLDYFEDMKITASIITVTRTLNTTTGRYESTNTVTGSIRGIKYNRSEASRYFSLTYAADITDVFVTDSITGITKDSVLLIGGISWACEEPVSVAELGEVYTIGIKRKA